jgi:hypothetical protein
MLVGSMAAMQQSHSNLHESLKANNEKLIVLDQILVLPMKISTVSDQKLTVSGQISMQIMKTSTVLGQI